MKKFRRMNEPWEQRLVQFDSSQLSFLLQSLLSFQTPRDDFEPSLTNDHKFHRFLLI